MPAVNEFTTEATIISNDDFAGIDVDIGAGIYDTQKFKAAKLGKRGSLVFVDSDLGSDSTGLRDRADRPFLTLTSAKAAAISGDTIIVRPGTYNEKNLLKTGVNWWFYPGASVIYTGVAAGAIFDDGVNGTAGAVISQVLGYGTFTSDAGGVLNISNALTNLQLAGITASSVTIATLAMSGGTVVLNFTTVSGKVTPVAFSGGGCTLTSANILSLIAGGSQAMVLSGGTHLIYSDTIVSANSSAILVSGTTSGRIVANTILGNGAGVQINSSGDFVVDASSITGNNAALSLIGSGGTARITADRLTSSGPATATVSISGSTSNHVQARKITSAAPPAIELSGSGVNRIIADQASSTGSEVVTIASGAGVHYLKINEYAGTSALDVDTTLGVTVSLTVDGGKFGTGTENGGVVVGAVGTVILTLLGVRVNGVISLPAAMNNLTIKDCLLVTSALNSIATGGACNVRNYGFSNSNKAADGGVTFIVGAAAFDVDTDVGFV